MIKKLFKSVQDRKTGDRRAQLYSHFLRQEARVGGQVFGDLPAGHKREFFCLDKHTWVWHEEWQDSSGQNHIVTTRYDVRADRILKSQNGNQYQPVEQEEALRLRDAAVEYQNRVNQSVYNFA